MDNRDEIRHFLASRRARISPQQAGLALGGRRRVPGLRREEVAVLAGVSTDWYTRLEKGHINGVSTDVLNAVARALQLDDAERAHLFDLARAAATGPSPRRVRKVRPGLQRMLDAMTDAPAIIRNGRMDIVAANRLGYAMYWPVFHSHIPTPGRGPRPDTARPQPANIARFQFLDPAGPDFFPDWDTAADITVALLRTEAGRDPYNKELTQLIGELSTRSDDFRGRWAQHNVRLHHTGTKAYHHPAVGDLVLDYESMDLHADPGLNLTVYTATPDTPSSDALRLLASWAATLDQPAQPHDADAQRR
ncbi:transcriptional regulator with XRE-family HTH domain [Thermocatellispora tengchongensis]|uniref:Transcriptional regulator with XRE-family HTH domain n=1 Tax=Thermocatellispora tengchongensis TaxID=1073253 RepID=A0A840PHJ7_9ACTN|nr:helix-turn-helix transcriptional regulator [Thermocatellispora tengchongensis]MBB5137291.1 transcriptional regulator with XRE-family HTH domain [Thermocatellispora tengchongensis]